MHDETKKHMTSEIFAKNQQRREQLIEFYVEQTKGDETQLF